MTSGIKKMSVFLVLVSGLFFCGLAVASEGAEGGSNVMEWVWKVVNFGILVFILVKFIGPAARDYFRKRTETIQKTLDEARQARELAEQALREVEKKLKNKDREMEEIISSSRLSGEKERDALAVEGERLSKKIIEQSKASIDFELKRAKEAIKAEAVELAMGLAEKKLREKLTPEEQKRLLEESLVKLEGKG
ncbi:MAG: ATP synthase F0 subunit B [Thermodesulfovibrionales bacterium]|nr:ATP synthase F0 subunit B [Thermodesulfovibrionales bacterium]